MRTILKFIVFIFAFAVNPAPANILSNIEFQPDHTLATDIPDSDIITHVGKEGMEVLFQRFMDHYGQFIDPENPRELDFEFVMGQSNHEVSRELQYLFGLALDEGQDFSDFEVFGITIKNNGHMAYNPLANHLFQLPDDLFELLLNHSNLDYVEQDLIQRGFQPMDIKILRSFINKYNLTHTLKEKAKRYWQMLDTLTPSILHAIANKQVLSYSYHRHTLLRPHYLSHFNTQQLYRNWGLSLLEVFEPRAQRILMSYLVESDDIKNFHLNEEVRVVEGMSPEEFILKIEKDIATGRWQQDIDAALNPYILEEELR